MTKKKKVVKSVSKKASPKAPKKVIEKPVQKTVIYDDVVKNISATQKKEEMAVMPRIKVIGVGGSGKSATNYMIKRDVKGVKFVVVNTDIQDLNQSKAPTRVHIGKTLTGGVGTGMNPEVGKQAALETKDEIIKVLQDASIVFITGGMGGGTGTGASPVISAIAKEMGILTIAVVTKPFGFEGNRRTQLADAGINELSKYVDAYIIIPNDKILEAADSDATMNEAFSLSDEVLLQAVTGVSNLITTPGRINIDTSDIKTVLKNSGMALVGIGSAHGEKRAEQAALKAINSPLLDISMNGAKAVLFSISAGDDLKMNEISTIANMITKEIDKNAVVKFGTIRDLKLKKDEIKVTVIASGFDKIASDSILSLPDEIYGDYRNHRIQEAQEIHIIDESVTGFSVKNQDMNIINDDEDDNRDIWSSVPSFLKKK